MNNCKMHHYIFAGAMFFSGTARQETTYKCERCGEKLTIKWPDQLHEFYAGECKEAEK